MPLAARRKANAKQNRAFGLVSAKQNGVSIKWVRYDAKQIEHILFDQCKADLTRCVQDSPNITAVYTKRLCIFV